MAEQKEIKGSLSRLIVAKIIALSVFIVVMILVISEVMGFAMYGIPYLFTEIARNVGVTSGADWVVGGILWAFPCLFLTIFLALLHYAVLKKIVVKLWRWMVAVMKKSVD